MRACVGDWKIYVNLTTALIRRLDSSVGAIQREFFLSAFNLFREPHSRVVSCVYIQCFHFPRISFWEDEENFYHANFSSLTHLQTFATLSGSKKAQEYVKFQRAEHFVEFIEKYLIPAQPATPKNEYNKHKGRQCLTMMLWRGNFSLLPLQKWDRRKTQLCAKCRANSYAAVM